MRINVLLHALAGCGMLVAGTGAPGSAADQATPQWSSIGPAGIITKKDGIVSGRVESIFFSADGSMLIGAANGGVWHRTASAWQPISETLPSLAMGRVVESQGVIYAGTGEDADCADCSIGAGLFSSGDKGKTWNHVAAFPAQTTSGVYVDRSDRLHVVTAGSAGIWMSHDGGRTAQQTWQKPVSDIVALHGALFLGDDLGIAASTDGGASWTRVSLPQLATRAQANPNERYDVALAAAGDGKTLYASVALTSTFQWGCIAGLLKSTDAGATWQLLPRSFSIGYSKTPISGIADYFGQPSMYGDGTACQGWYDNAIAVNPADANDVTVGGISTFRSRDGGKTWLNLSVAFDLHPDVHAISYGPDGTLAIGTDGGVWSFDAANRVADLNDGLAITQFYGGLSMTAGATAALAGTQDNGTLIYDELASHASTFSWTQVYGGDGGYTALDSRAASRFYAEYVRAALVRSEDKGSHWTPISPPIIHAEWVAPFRLDPAQPDRVLVGADQIYAGDARGTKWSKLTNAPLPDGVDVSALDVGPIGTKTILAGWGQGLVIFSSDGGTTWSDVTPNVTARAGGAAVRVADVKIDPTNAKRIYVALRFAGAGRDSAGIYTCDDASRPAPDWRDITSNIPSAPNVLLLSDAVYVGTDSGLFRRPKSADSQTWETFGIGMPAVPIVDVHGDAALMIAMSHGRGAWVLAHPVASR